MDMGDSHGHMDMSHMDMGDHHAHGEEPVYCPITGKLMSGGHDHMDMHHHADISEQESESEDEVEMPAEATKPVYPVRSDRAGRYRNRLG